MTTLPQKKFYSTLALALTILTTIPTHAAPSICPPTQQIQAQQFTVVEHMGARWDYATKLLHAGITWFVHYNTWFENKVDQTNSVEMLAQGNHKFHTEKLLVEPIVTTSGDETMCRYSDTSEFYVIATSSLN